MNTSFSIKLIALITLSLFANLVCAINFKTDLKKETNAAALPNWQQPHAPDYAAELQKYNPSKKEPDKQQAKEFMANAKQNVSFLENKGQMMDTEGKPVPFALFKAEAPGMNVYITEKGLTYVFVKIEEDEDEEKEERKRGKHKDLMLPGKHDEKLKAEMAWINVNLKGANIKRENIIKEEQSTEHFNYFYGHCPDGIYDVYQYKKLTVKNVYPNIDWVFYNSQKGGMKYDFILNPGANPNDIKLIYESEKPLDLDKNGNLQLKTTLGTLTENAPYSYIQENNTEVKSSFKTTKLNKHEVKVTFTLDQSTYTQASALVIDPQLVWGTFLGGNGLDGPKSIDTDNNGNVFVTGYTFSTNFPLQNSGTYFQSILTGDKDVFILKFSNNGNLLWATYYGGSLSDLVYSICTDSNGNVFVTGETTSTNFPLQNAGTFFQGTLNVGSDAFILKFSNNGNRLWATYYGGSAPDTGTSICTDSNGNVFVTGYTFSTNFPLQNSGTFFQSILTGDQEVFILKFDNNGNRLWATYYGGSLEDSGTAISTDSNGNVFVTGFIQSVDFPVQNAGTFFQGTFGGGLLDLFILKFDNNGNRLWATYYGGSNDDQGNSICIDSNGNVVVAGNTSSTDFPVQNAGTFFQGTLNGGSDAFILKFSNNGNRLWATYFGGSGDEYSFLLTYNNLSVDGCNNIYLSFETNSNPFPHLLSSSACSYFDNSYNGSGDILIARFTNTGSLQWCSYIGGNASDFRCAITVDINNNLYITGEWSELLTAINSATYPLTNPGAGAYYQAVPGGALDDGYIVKLSPSQIQKQVSQVNTTNCQCNGSATFSITCGDAPYSYVWSNGQSVLNTTATSHTITNLCAGVYNVTVTAGCTQSVVETYTINGSGLNSIVNITTYSSTGCSTPNGSVVINSITNSVPPYTLTEGTNTLALNVVFPYTITPVSVGSHTYVLTNNTGCATVFTANVIGVTPINNIPTYSGNLCIGATATLTSASANTYTWQGPNNFTSNLQNPVLNNLQLNNSGVYTINITSQNNCIYSNTLNLQIKSLPIVTASVNNIPCEGQVVNLVGSGSGNNYLWLGPNNFSSTNATTSIQNIQINQQGNYSLTTTDLNGCTNSTLVNVNVNKSPSANIISNAMSSCPPLCVGYSFSPSTDVDSYGWSLQNNNYSVLNTATINKCYTKAGIYNMQLNVKGKNGCVSKSIYSVEVYPKPIADFVFNPTNPTLNDNDVVTFKDATGYGAPTQWTWHFLTETKNTITKFGNEATYKYSEAGTYPISLVVTNKYGCIDTVVKSIVIADDYGLFIPNAFTPNNDGVNDTFVPKGHVIKSYTLVIFDRWGEQLYKTNHFETVWDGYYKGQLCKSDVYTWKINCVDVKNKSHELVGSLTLIK